MSLKNLALSSVKWNIIANFGFYFISFFLSIILARLLDPSEFGLLGMLSIFTSVALVFINSGLSTAIIRTKEATPDDYSTVFYFNIFISTCFYILLFFFAPYIAIFYNEPELVPLTRLISLVFFLNSFGIIQNALLVKEINFKKQAICNLVGLALAAVVSGAMALNGFGVYSIVGQAITQALVTNLLFWVTSDWRPSGGFKKASFLKLWSFSSKILATNIISKIVENIDNVLIGKIFSTQQLGFYIRAKSSKQLPEQIFTGVLSSTAFAILSKVNNNEFEFKRLHLHFFKLGIYVFFPVIFGFIAIAEAFTVVLYSAKWLPSVPIFQIIAISSITYFLGALFSQTIMAKGDGKLYFRLTTAKKFLGLLSIPFGLFGGLYPFIISFVVLNLIGLLLDFIFTGRMLKIKVVIYIKALIKPTITAIIMSVIVYFVGYYLDFGYFLKLFIQLIIGIVLYIAFSYILKVTEFFYVKEIVITKIEQALVKLNIKKDDR
jgi:teichuronic acid exporter